MTHILLAEDEVKLAQFLELELNYQGYQVSVAYDGLTAMIATQKLQLDLIILDWMIPSLSGWEICHSLRSHANNIPIILLCHKHQLRDNYIDVGADDYLCKPFEVEELLAKVCTHLSKKQQDFLSNKD
ncbi:Response regulator receiver domain protein CheY [Nostoc sp. NIES-3756]|uniref:response regulator transcription factor n=1 Tax=Nostoc sp. NIES-3756 TaxID=1751286 RepID=UPI00072244D4|nr:response regulator transcription factor [Nostoc sp. NIES-3756]BAT54336.1 Response regulator receiver domain protein CheY [Nostoc sp. NIES-3756]